MPPRYHYKVRRSPGRPLAGGVGHVSVKKDAEAPLSGFVDGMPAKQDEERFYRAIGRQMPHSGVAFRKPLGAPRGLPGQIELDFLVANTGSYRAFEIDDLTFVHRGVDAQADMVIKDEQRLQFLHKEGYPVMQIEHVDAATLKTQENADAVVERLFG